jgi:outer membrane protein OmpA-like peptidoglycan-associated protein
MKTSHFLAATALLGAVGCANTTPTPELVSAREAYDRARTSHAATYSPDMLLSARTALEAAERAHDDDPQSEREVAKAYVAERRAELAMVSATIKQNELAKVNSQKEYGTLQDSLRASAQSELRASRGTVQSLEAQNREAASRLNQTSAQLAQEKQARQEAEAKAQRALESLQKIASVKEEARGTVITLSGEVLFVTGKSELLPAARDRLNDVAKAILDGGDDRPITVEGHTDSRGSDDSNAKLSQDRADAVRNYLVSLGVKPDTIVAQGRGEARPVASNDTAEGRANNRRVEIVIGGPPRASTAPPTAAPR